MKIIKYIGLSLLLWAGTQPVVQAEDFRTDINPALIYYQTFLLVPALQDARYDYLFTNNWQGLRLSAQFGTLISRYDHEMEYLHRAAAQKTPCDWGIDLSLGPETLLPELAFCKRAAITSRLHAMWELQQGNEAAACNDLLGALALGRNSSRDGTLIGVLVQIAIENIVCATVAENFNRFSPASLQRLEDGFAAGPERGAMVSCMTAERFSSGQWLHRQIEALQKAHPNDEAAAMTDLQQLVNSVQYEDNTNFWSELTNASGGTVSGVLNTCEQAETFFKQLTTIMALPHGEFEKQMNQFDQKVIASKNYLMFASLGAWPNSRRKEFTILENLAMVHAALECKLHGDAGLQSVMDPLGNGPFKCERFSFLGEDRGFKLTSAYIPSQPPMAIFKTDKLFFPGGSVPSDQPVSMIFVEKTGPTFNVLGTHVGERTSP